jgi:hypothetical protein
LIKVPETVQVFIVVEPLFNVTVTGNGSPGSLDAEGHFLRKDQLIPMSTLPLLTLVTVTVASVLPVALSITAGLGTPGAPVTTNSPLTTDRYEPSSLILSALSSPAIIESAVSFTPLPRLTTLLE